MPTLRLGMAIIAAAIVLPGPLKAQTNPAAQQSQGQQNAAQPRGPGAPNVTPSRRDEPGSSSATTSTPPIAGANSFTEGQARDRIAKAGYTDVQSLKLDDNGIWRGRHTSPGSR